MGSQNQNKSRRVRIEHDFREHNRPYGYTSDEGLRFYLMAYTRRWLHETGMAKGTFKWHMRAIVTEMNGRKNGVLDRLE